MAGYNSCTIYARLPSKADGQGCRARLPGKGGAMNMVQYAESMVKLVKNAVF
jgi:hypothetical protein